MEQNYELTTGRYFLELTKIFFQSMMAHYLKRDDAKLERLYYKTMDIHERYIEQNCDDEEKEERYREKVYELLELIILREQKDILKMKQGKEQYQGMKLRENIMEDMYLELWLIEEGLWLYIFEGRGAREELIPYEIEDPYLFRIDQVYLALKEKRIKNKELAKL